MWAGEGGREGTDACCLLPAAWWRVNEAAFSLLPTVTVCGVKATGRVKLHRLQPMPLDLFLASGRGRGRGREESELGLRGEAVQLCW